MPKEPPIVVDGLRVYNADGGYAVVTNYEARMLSCLLSSFPRVSFYDYIIRWVYDDSEPEQAMNCLAVFKNHLNDKLHSVGWQIVTDKGVGYRIKKLDFCL